MRGLTIFSLAFILALSSTVAVAAPRAAVLPVPKASVNVLEGALNNRSASCLITGPCRVLSPPGTCCGKCILVNSELGYCHDKSASCKMHGACSFLSPLGTCCGTCNLVNIVTGYCVPPRSPPS